MKKIFVSAIILLLATPAFAREVNYTGDEEQVFIKPGEPTQIVFPSKIEGGFKPTRSNLALERHGNYLIVVGQAQLPPDGEGILVHIDDKRTYALRVMPVQEGQQKDVTINIQDSRPPEVEETAAPTPSTTPQGFPPPSTVKGLLREMILVAEFGKQKGITGYRRSNRFSGQTVLNDGAIEAKVDEIFMGTDLWGYVLNVENKLGTAQRINPATFRLDGTKAVTAQRWELAPQPLTTEEQVSQGNQGKVYIITRAKRR